MKKDKITGKKVQVKEAIQRSLIQGAIAAAVAGLIGMVFGLVKGLDPMGGAIRLIYALGVVLIVIALFSAPALMQRLDNRNKTYSKEEIQLSMKERNDRLRTQWMAYLRAFVVLLIAILLETIKFYVL